MESQDIVQDGTLLNAYPMDVIRSATQDTESKKISHLVEVGELPEARKVASQPLQFRRELNIIWRSPGRRQIRTEVHHETRPAFRVPDPWKNRKSAERDLRDRTVGKKSNGDLCKGHDAPSLR